MIHHDVLRFVHSHNRSAKVKINVRCFALPCFAMMRSAVWLLLLLLVAGGSRKAANALATKTKPPKVKVGRVSAGPIEISSLGCGTWSWGNRLLFDYDPSQDEGIFEAYREIRNAGVTIFDTADSYGTFDLNGQAEKLLGRFERRYQDEIAFQEQGSNNNIQNWWDFSGGPKSKSKPNVQQVATKLAPYPWRVTPSQIVSAAEASLKRLEQDKLAVAQLHWSTANYQPFQEKALWEGIGDVYDKGLCESVGFSNYGQKQLLKVSDYMKERQVPVSVAQIQYSLMTYKDAKTMNSACDDVNCRLIAYSPLCLGLLTGKYTLDNLPRQGNPRRQLFRELLPGAQELLGTLNAVAAEYGKSQTQVAINWAICKGTVPIPGARTIQQARENLGSTGWSLKRDAVEELDLAASRVEKPMIQNIFQTK
jgi:pyridoxine 4-dehydrogenase